MICQTERVVRSIHNGNLGDQARRRRQEAVIVYSHALIEVDGGVQAETAPRLVKAGVDVLVSGSYVFKADNPEETIRQLRNL